MIEKEQTLFKGVRRDLTINILTKFSRPYGCPQKYKKS